MDEIFTCPVCSEVLEQVVETPCCHKCYCAECIKSWTAKASTCPECRTTITFAECKPNFPIQRLIDNMPVQCEYEGCTDKVTRGTRLLHLQKCELAPVSCPLQPNDCDVPLRRKDLVQHQKECLYRLVSCPMCGQENIVFSKLQDHETSSCDLSSVSCPQCKQNMYRKDFNKHPEQCIYRQLDCPYSKYGCKFAGHQEDLNKHIESSPSDHLSLVVAAIEIKEQESKLFLNKISSMDLELKRYRDFVVMYKPTLPYSHLNHLPFMFPSKLTLHSVSVIVTLEANCLTVTYRPFINLFKSGPSPAICVPGDVLIPKFDGTYYFEATVENPGKDCAIGIGLVAHNHNMNGMPGWEKGYGYHGDDGRVFSEKLGGQGLVFGPTFGKDDVVGLGWDQQKGVIFFTKNGTHLGTPFNNVDGQYYPVIGLHTPGARVRVNFGQEPFIYKVI